jgi:4-hydroxy-3-polyprenylbenzoate decarboxylase
MAIPDLNEWIDLLEKEGELARITTKVDWNLELGGITQETFDREGPALLFENIKDYENTICKRFFTGTLATYPRIALMLGLPKETPYKDLIDIWRQKSKSQIKPKIVETGPVKENIIKGDDIDLHQFPAPFWHKLDGHRYIGTFDGVVTKHRDTDWINVGLYRRAVHNKKQLGITFTIGQHIWMHWRSYRKRGENVPVAVACGWNPILPAVASAHLGIDVCEYDVMGGILGEPVELVKCETSELLVPATAQIVFEGELDTNFDSFIMEGPFGEYTGYYCTVPHTRPVFNVKCITFRNDPILQGTLEGVPINEDHRVCSVHHSASIRDLLDERMSGVTAVNVDPSTGWTNVFVQIDNSYVGQVQQVAANIWSSGVSVMVGKNVFVFDRDIDIFDLKKVMWAIGYRLTPDRDITMFPGWISPLDPSVHPKDRVHEAVKKGNRLLFDCTKPIDWPRTDDWFGERFPPLAYPDEETMNQVRANWGKYGINA